MKAIKNILAFAGAIAIAVTVVCAGLLPMGINLPRFGGKSTIDCQVLEETLVRNNELSTSSYLYTDSEAIIDQNTLDLLDIGEVALPFTDSTYIFEFDGTIKAGFDLNEVVVAPEASAVVVTLPEAKVLSHETGSLCVKWESQSVCNPLHAGEEHKWIEEQKEKMEQRAIDCGLFEEARHNAEGSIRSLLESTLPDDVRLEVRFRSAEAS